MPANLGYISAMLFNQNNCCPESSTVTTTLEVEVGNDFCVMMGYEKDKCTGHLTSGGTIGNIEAIWAARNVKYFPLGLQEAFLHEEKLADARGYKVRNGNFITHKKQNKNISKNQKKQNKTNQNKNPKNYHSRSTHQY